MLLLPLLHQADSSADSSDPILCFNVLHRKVILYGLMVNKTIYFINRDKVFFVKTHNFHSCSHCDCFSFWQWIVFWVISVCFLSQQIADFHCNYVRLKNHTGLLFSRKHYDFTKPIPDRCIHSQYNTFTCVTNVGP